MSIKILRSALKHGFSKSDILAAYMRIIGDIRQQEEPLKIMRIGLDDRLRALEIGFEVDDDGDVVIFHAMKARRFFFDLINRANGGDANERRYERDDH